MTNNAKAIIEKELQAKTGKLDLTNCGLTSIPTEISQMVWLKNLRLSDNQITTIEGLDTLPQLQELDLHLNQISKIENLEQLTELESLNLGHNNISEIENLDNLAQLKMLFLPQNQISTIKNLDKLHNLRTLHIGYNNITATEGLTALPALDTLYIRDNNINSIDKLSQLPKLKKLFIQNNPVSDLSPTLSPFFRSLNALDLTGTKIHDIQLFYPSIQAGECTVTSKVVTVEYEALQRQQANRTILGVKDCEHLSADLMASIQEGHEATVKYIQTGK